MEKGAGKSDCGKRRCAKAGARENANPGGQPLMMQGKRIESTSLGLSLNPSTPLARKRASWGEREEVLGRV